MSTDWKKIPTKDELSILIFSTLIINSKFSHLINT